MSARGASVAVQAEWIAVANAPAHLIELRLDAADGGTIWATDSYRTIVWNGNTYTALGHMLGFSGLSESAELRVADLSVQLSGVDQTMIATVLDANYIDRRFLIYQFFLDTSDAVIASPVLIHDGRISEAAVQEDGEGGASSVTLKSRDSFADFERLNGRHTNPLEQRYLFPNDASFDLLPQLAGQNRQLIWGAASPSAAAQAVVSTVQPAVVSAPFDTGSGGVAPGGIDYNSFDWAG